MEKRIFYSAVLKNKKRSGTSSMKTLLVLFLIFLTGCQLGPKYHPPCVKAPAVWKHPIAQGTLFPQVQNWWEVFQDEQLNSLEQQAVACNPELFGAIARIEEALAIAGISRADLFPQLNFAPDYTAFHFKSDIDFSQNVKKALPSLPSLTKDRFWWLTIYNIPLILAYEVDLWGKFRSAHKAACRNVEAQKQAYGSLLLTLTSSLASSYYKLRALDATLAHLEGIIETYKANLILSSSSFEKGLVDYINVANDETALANANAIYYEALALRGIQENMIAAFIGIPAPDFHLEPIPLSSPPPTIPPGIPSEILLRRPDLAEAERQMAAQHALIGAAYASFFPSINLTAALGIFNFDLRRFVDFTAKYLSAGVFADQTIFDGLRKFENYKASWARFWGAESSYQKLVLAAFREVEDALNNIECQTNAIGSLKLAFEASAERARLACHRNAEGLVNRVEVIDDERAQLTAGLNYTVVLGLLYQSTIQLIKALGGGW
jgi:outer membrane protein, multidrug efflux system